MKVLLFHCMPYRQPAPEQLRDPNDRLQITIPKYLFDGQLAARFYSESLDELEYAASLGFDGLCMNEHHQMAYGLMPSPNLTLAALARRTDGVALVALGTSAALYNPPIRLAEEYSMLDCISGGRVVAGFPVGSTTDANYAYGINPTTLRERYYEAVQLITKAWTEPEVFNFNGRYTQLRYVSGWPRPLQSPHPPIWIPGGNSIETWSWTIEREYLYTYLSYSGYQDASRSMAGYWETVDRLGRPRNPYRTAFMQLVCVGNSKDEVEETYAPHVEYLHNRLLARPQGGGYEAPGYLSQDSTRASLMRGRPPGAGGRRTWQDFVNSGAVVAGTPKEVTEELEQLARGLNTGHLLLMAQIASMPHTVAMENIRLIATEVLPNLRHVFDETDFQDDWWLRPVSGSEA